MSDGSWHVLVERDVRAYDSVAGDSATYHRREPARSGAAPQGREQARETAEEVTRTCVPEEGSEEGSDPEGKPARTVCRMSADSWLMEVRHEYRQRHCRVCVVELVHTEEAGAGCSAAAGPALAG
ncbi:hypothetical protein, partial [Kitasatospora sp. NPDC057223]|uniref:hypothetical protein n=1 Tax=Kitasatospora sp. NPDC057223 TaxID=3346055 RepID=UPI00363F3417